MTNGGDFWGPLGPPTHVGPEGPSWVPPPGELPPIGPPWWVYGSLALLDLAAIAFAAYRIWQATKPPDLPPPLPPLGCSRTGGLVGGSERGGGFAYSCRGAIEDTAAQADAKCRAHTTCAGKCPSGAPCTPFASITAMQDFPALFGCRAVVDYRCECGC